MVGSRMSPPEVGRSRPRNSLPVRGATAGPKIFVVVGIGASAGGLDACRKLLLALPADTGMAFILVQHLDPTHESMMVDLLAGHTAMTVRQATDGMPIAPDHVYVIPPGTYLSVSGGALRLSQPQARHGARLPFDFLLQSLAEDRGAHAIAVILSGTGADGSVGLKTIKEHGGLVVAQDPEEASFGGMPQSAIMTGQVDFVLPVAEIPGKILEYSQQINDAHRHNAEVPHSEIAQGFLQKTIDILRTKTPNDFRLYKQGTLQRRVERRMAFAGVDTSDMNHYLDILENDNRERDLLAKDLLINVTSFFRDSKVFDLLTTRIVPDLVRDHPSEHPLRIWIVGCSTGEETYSLAMLFREEIAATKRNIKLQIFASDVDPDAVATAREGLYPETIEADVCAERLGRFFSKDDHGYRVLPELRATVVFTVQDVLADPPFSHLDLVSCRNLLIYLRPEAQERILSLFHFSLREDGILLLGSAEAVPSSDSRFAVISQPEGLYRHIGRSRPGEIGLLMRSREDSRAGARPGQGQAASRQTTVADVCRRLLMEAYAPAAVLINRKRECLYSIGPTDRFLRLASGHPTNDLLAMAREDLRIKLRSAIHRAIQENVRVVVGGGRVRRNGVMIGFSIEVQPVPSEGEELLLVCFVETPMEQQSTGGTPAPRDAPRVAELERELDATRMELQGAIRDLEISVEEHRAASDEALSINEEYQSTNEELLTSKEELQSLNEELAALNGQLQETLERQRSTANDLQNILYSTDVATLFLDINLNIRFFTPAIQSLFSLIPADIGRPLGNFTSLAPDGALLADARRVLQTPEPIEREIQAGSGAWFIRRILPYRTQDNGVEGVVITFVDITARRRVSDALEAAQRQAEQASDAKSRFLAAASHDLRQPLQALSLLQGLLERTVEEEKAQKLVARLGRTLNGITSTLDTLLDVNQIDAGVVHPEVVSFPINGLLQRLRDEFSYQAQAKGLALRVVPCTLWINSDPRLLEEMVRNLVSNALKYTRRGKVLLGCRRRGKALGIEIRDTGIGIPEAELQAIFEEYHQVDNAARERSRGLGLGLAIVRRLAALLGHRIDVRSRLGKGSVFTIEAALSPQGVVSASEPDQTSADGRTADDSRRSGVILVVEDDPEVCELLELLLKDEGHRAATAHDGIAALEWVQRGNVRPDLILADYNLPNGMTGLQVGAKLREVVRRDIPVVILTGDISAATLRDIASHDCVQLNKPVRMTELTQVIQHLLPIAAPVAQAQAPHGVEAGGSQEPPVVFVVDDDSHVREILRDVLQEEGLAVEDYATCEAFLAAYRPRREACLVIDAYLPGMNGLELLQRLQDAGDRLPSIMLTANRDVAMVVKAMQAGAMDFIEKPVGRGELLGSIERALEHSRDSSLLANERVNARKALAALTPRQRQIVEAILAGHANKNIAADLGISQRTVESHRAAIMKRTGSASLPALTRLAVSAARSGPEESPVQGDASTKPNTE